MARTGAGFSRQHGPVLNNMEKEANATITSSMTIPACTVTTSFTAPITTITTIATITGTTTLITTCSVSTTNCSTFAAVVSII